MEETSKQRVGPCFGVETVRKTGSVKQTGSVETKNVPSQMKTEGKRVDQSRCCFVRQ